MLIDTTLVTDCASFVVFWRWGDTSSSPAPGRYSWSFVRHALGPDCDALDLAGFLQTCDNQTGRRRPLLAFGRGPSFDFVDDE